MSSQLRRRVNQRHPIVPFLCGCLLTYLATYSSRKSCPTQEGSSIKKTSSETSVFKGKQYWKDGFTQNVKTLYETPFARFQLHSVKLENGKIVDDWMWFDEADNINVLVEKESTENPNWPPTYVVLKQKKYGLPETTLAAVGGLIEPGEQPLDAAKRELQEELGLESPKWVPLGKYRAAANRGGGTTYCFLARKSTPIANAQDSKGTDVAVGESEKQDLVELSKDDLIDALLKGKFQEIKWTATIALSIIKTTHHFNR
ncbi:expressed unknown protein [Seminavis robusta]|uniref:Nudix hydrolase domain-containing protein n=1 Tax=Seminavis robusta TaxID=568900 RepID=A0A9N8DJ20_9STRA|nr:expressed unknown protein [Seminavis robusta]|eukprot:Sro185_g080240.1 n/a (258) ;mRNA; f:18215-18988